MPRTLIFVIETSSLSLRKWNAGHLVWDRWLPCDAILRQSTNFVQVQLMRVVLRDYREKNLRGIMRT